MSLNKAEVVRERLLALLRATPWDYGIQRSRWRLKDILAVVKSWLPITSISGLWRLLQRLGICFRKSWSYQTSPDPLADIKLTIINVLKRVSRHRSVTLLWLDELTIYQSSSPAPTWTTLDKRGRKAHQATTDETIRRLVGTLNHHTGQVHYHLRKKMGIKGLQSFYPYLRRQYPDTDEIYVIQDCWPTHFLPPVCRTAIHHDLTLIPLPTYSSWRNPIEQLWRWLKQDVLYMHPWSDCWSHVEHATRQFLDQFRSPNKRLLHYVGLLT